MPFAVDGRQIEILSVTDGPAIASLYRDCADYWTLVTARPAGAEAAAGLLGDRPPVVPLSNKIVLGLRDNHRLVVIVDALRDYPGPGIWWLGLLLVSPESRGRGLGRRLYAAFEAWAAGQGATELRLCVQVQNTGAHTFWQRLGFVASGSKPLTLDGLTSQVTIYRRSISGEMDATGQLGT
jgi:GNAT superfamily N-acetyltransferase